MPTLYRKYRPSTFQEISGQEYILQTLTNALKNSRLSHAYLFTGPRGTGKTTIARIFAKTANCLKPVTKTKKDYIGIEPCNKCLNCQTVIKNKAIDLIEIDAASHTGVDNIRQLKEAINIPPTNFKYKVYIIDEVHMLSIGAFNALLKTLEEPPPHAIFILATTELYKIPTTIISRCQQFNIKPLTKNQIIIRLQELARKEKIKINKKALLLIATEAEGGMRDAESLLEQIISLGDKNITTTSIQQTLGISPQDTLAKLIDAITQGDMSTTIIIINELQENGINLKSFNKQLLNYFRNLMLVKIVSDNTNGILLKNLTDDEIISLENTNKKLSLTNLTILISFLQSSLKDFNQSDIPQLPLEMALIEYFLKTEQNLIATNQKISKNYKQLAKIKNTSQKKTNSKVISKKTNSKKKSTKNLNAPLPQKKSTSSDNPAPSINSSAISINNFLDKWAEVLEGVKEKSLSIAGVLKNCAPININQEIVLIKVNHTFGKDRLNNPQSKLTIEKVFANIFKVRLKAKFLTEDELPQNVIAKDSTDSKNNDKNNSNQKSITNDNELLYEAMKKIGGKIIKQSN